MHVTLCDFIVPWDTLSTTQKKSLNHRYQMGCECKVSRPSFRASPRPCRLQVGCRVRPPALQGLSVCRVPTQPGLWGRAASPPVRSSGGDGALRCPSAEGGGLRGEGSVARGPALLGRGALLWKKFVGKLWP